MYWIWAVVNSFVSNFDLGAITFLLALAASASPARTRETWGNGRRDCRSRQPRACRPSDRQLATQASTAPAASRASSASRPRATARSPSSATARFAPAASLAPSVCVDGARSHTAPPRPSRRNPPSIRRRSRARPKTRARVYRSAERAARAGTNAVSRAACQVVANYAIGLLLLSETYRRPRPRSWSQGRRKDHTARVFVQVRERIFDVRSLSARRSGTFGALSRERAARDEAPTTTTMTTTTMTTTMTTTRLASPGVSQVDARLLLVGHHRLGRRARHGHLDRRAPRL